MTSDQIEAELAALQRMACADRPTVATSSCTDPNCDCKAGGR